MEQPSIVQALPAEQPSIVQALPAEQPRIIRALPTEQSRIVRVLPGEQLHIIQALPATPRKQKERIAGATRSSSLPAPTISSRCTRLQAAPDWSTYETLVLLNEIASMDEDWLKALSSYQKWEMITDNCAASNVVRSSNQCKRRWKSLLSAHSKIKEWEFKHGEGSYWSLDGEKKKHLLGLPYMLVLPYFVLLVSCYCLELYPPMYCFPQKKVEIDVLARYIFCSIRTDHDSNIFSQQYVSLHSNAPVLQITIHLYFVQF